MRAVAWIGILMLVCASSAVLAGSTNVVHDPETDFFSYKTYHWGESDMARSPELRAHLEEEVDRWLDIAGLKRVENGGDLTISIMVAGETTASHLVGFYSRVTYNVMLITSDFNSFDDATLSIDLVDSFRNQAVWHGQSSARFNSADFQVMRKKISKAVKKLFRDYPPVTPISLQP
jgi:hypothetical protein